MNPTAGGADLELAKAYIDGSFHVDANQRFEVGLAVGGIGFGKGVGPDIGNGEAAPAPSFLLLRTRLGCLWRFRADLRPETIRELAKLTGREGGVAPPFELALPPERLEPMLRVLRRSGVEALAVRELLLCRAGFAPGQGSVSIARFGVDGADSLAGAQLGSVAWEQRRMLPELEVGEWVSFGDALIFVDAAVVQVI